MDSPRRLHPVSVELLSITVLDRLVDQPIVCEIVGLEQAPEARSVTLDHGVWPWKERALNRPLRSSIGP